jgi:hypothetical protein
LRKKKEARTRRRSRLSPPRSKVEIFGG